MQGCKHKGKSIGVTLIEVVVVVTILSLMALVAIPSFTSNDKYQLDLASNEIAYAIRFARTEAMRTGNVYGVDIDRISKQITIYKADLVSNPVGQEFIAYHPIHKNLYNYNLISDLKLSMISIDNIADPFSFSDSVQRKTLLFDAKGTPIWIDTGTGNVVQLSSGSVELSQGTHGRSVSVKPYTGRVIVQ